MLPGKQKSRFGNRRDQLVDAHSADLFAFVLNRLPPVLKKVRKLVKVLLWFNTLVCVCACEYKSQAHLDEPRLLFGSRHVEFLVPCQIFSFCRRWRA